LSNARTAVPSTQLQACCLILYALAALCLLFSRAQCSRFIHAGACTQSTHAWPGPLLLPDYPHHHHLPGAALAL